MVISAFDFQKIAVLQFGYWIFWCPQYSNWLFSPYLVLSLVIQMCWFLLDDRLVTSDWSWEGTHVLWTSSSFSGHRESSSVTVCVSIVPSEDERLIKVEVRSLVGMAVVFLLRSGIRVQGEPPEHPEEEPSWQLQSGRSRNYSHTFVIAHYRVSAGPRFTRPGKYKLCRPLRLQPSLKHNVHTLSCTHDLNGCTFLFFFTKFTQGVCRTACARECSGPQL